MGILQVLGPTKDEQQREADRTVITDRVIIGSTQGRNHRRVIHRLHVIEGMIQRDQGRGSCHQEPKQPTTSEELRRTKHQSSQKPVRKTILIKLVLRSLTNHIM